MKNVPCDYFYDSQASTTIKTTGKMVFFIVFDFNHFMFWNNYKPVVDGYTNTRQLFIAGCYGKHECQN
jgi:hypothetical protein